MMIKRVKARCVECGSENLGEWDEDTYCRDCFQNEKKSRLHGGLALIALAWAAYLWVMYL